MSERTDVLVISDAVCYVTIKQMETILKQMKRSICMIKGKSAGTGFFYRIINENKDIPCLITSNQVIDDEYIKENKKIEISLNDNEINDDIILSQEDIIYTSKKEEYDLIIIKLKEEGENGNEGGDNSQNTPQTEGGDTPAPQTEGGDTTPSGDQPSSNP